MNSIHFRYFKNNMQSIAVLMPLIPGADIVYEPCDGIMLYSFASQQAPDVFQEVGHSKTHPIFIAGGPHPSARPDDTLRFFDFVVLGEGEETLPELIKILQKKGDVSSVRGIAFKDKNSIVHTEKREHVTLDRYPPFDINGVRSTIEITRGCPFSCAYCQTPQLFGHRMRHRSIDEIARYAKFLKDVRFTSPNAFAYGSDGIRPRIEKIEALLKNLPHKNIFFGTFPSEVRPEFINDRILELVSDHCANTTLSLGGQSGSQRVLDMIHRRHTVDDIIAASEKCLQHGFTPVVDFIFGLPGETEGDQLGTLHLIQWLTGKGGKVHSHYFMKLPGTEFAKSTPATLSVQVEKTMGKLALLGKTTGVWSKA
jgi:B12-binding domain/radical SAM domain protein